MFHRSFTNGPDSMNKLRRRITSLFVFVLCILTLLFAQDRPKSVNTASAQTSRPVLFSDADSTRAVVVESVTNKREPFSSLATVPFATDHHTRIMLIAGNLRLAPGELMDAVTADAEDESRRIFPLKVEYVGPLPNQEWATSVVVRLDEQMEDVGDVLVRVFYKGIASNRVRVGIGHVGGGPPDDLGRCRHLARLPS